MAHDNPKLNPTQAQEYLTGAEYPADKEELIDIARENGANQQVIQFLETIPEREYDSPKEVTEMIGSMDQDEQAKTS
jgi:hypothetical protein